MKRYEIMDESAAVRLYRKTYKKKVNLASYRGLVALNIRTKKNNIFMTLVRVSDGATLYALSSGKLNFKLAKKRRSFEAFLKILSHIAKFCHLSRFYKLAFIRIIIRPVQGRKWVIGSRNIEFLLNCFYKFRIKVQKVLLVLKRVHGIPPRGKKLRRK